MNTQMTPKTNVKMTKKKTKKSVWQQLGYPDNHGKPWTAAAMWTLVELYYQENPRLTWRSIANHPKVKRTIEACQNRIWIIRLAYSLFKNEEAEKVMKMIEKHSGEVVYHNYEGKNK